MIAALLVPALAAAQFDSATVLGTVADQQSGTMPGATVTLTNLATGIVATTTSGADGAYQFLNVRVGSYKIRGPRSRASRPPSSRRWTSPSTPASASI